MYKLNNMGRSPCCEKTGLKKGPWTQEEDQKLIAFIQKHGHGSWRALPAKAGLRRCGKSCRLRWINYLKPDIKRGKFSLQEEHTIIQLHALLGNRWSTIASHLPKRTDNDIKNYWNTHLKKRLDGMGIDPTTHKLKIEFLVHSKDGSDLGHMAQWESARLEAEARLVRESKLQEQQNNLGSTSSSTPQQTRLVLKKITPQQQQQQQPPLSILPCLDVLKAWQSSWSNNNNNNNKNSSLPLLDNNKKTMHVHSMYAMMLATDDLESPASTLCFPESVQMNNNNNNHNNNNNSNTMVSTNHVGLINENYLLPPTTVTVDEFITKSIGTTSSEGATATVNGGGDNESWRYFTKHNTEEEIAETEKRITYDSMSCLQDDDDIMVVVEASRAAGYGGNNMVGFNNDFDSYEALAPENFELNFE